MRTNTRARLLVVTLGIVVAPILLSAQINEQGEPITPDDVERLLVPICPPNGQEGRFGAFWRCEMWIRNSADAPVLFAWGGPYSTLGERELIVVEPSSTQFDAAAARGAMYIVDKTYSSEIHLSVRIADTTRRPVNQGTEIPIVRERDWLAAPVELLDISTDASVRGTLRVYDPDAMMRPVRVVISPLHDNTVLAETLLEPAGGNRSPGTPWYRYPDYAEVPDLVAAFPQIATSERLRVRIEPTVEGQRFWAFVTITDNVTQQVTVVAPQ